MDHFATIFEAIADELPGAAALLHGDGTTTWGAFDDRSARAAAVLADAGARAGTKVAICLYNCPEWLEAWTAALKLRAIPVNVNYRYVDDELAYLLEDSDSEVIVYDATLADRIDRVRSRVGAVRTFIQVDRDKAGGPAPSWALDYESAIAAADPLPRVTRSEDDVVFTYTGGTTGLPKGVINHMGLMVRGVYYFGAGQGIDDWPTQLDRGFLRRLSERGEAPVGCPLCPLMHGTGLLGATTAMVGGGAVVTLPSRNLDVEEVLAAVERHRVTSIAIAGDAVARPILHRLDAPGAGARTYDLSSVRVVVSAGVAWSAEVKVGLLEHLPHATLHDVCGSTEGGIGSRRTRRGESATTTVFTPVPGLRVLRDDGSEVEPGSDERGRVATPSNSLGYYKDPDKTAATYRVIDGVRYALAGDWALRQADGSIVLLGRGHTVINTGGEKVFPEEVEEVVKSFPGVADCLVTGTPHDRFGSQVTAVVSRLDGVATADHAKLMAHVRTRLADYKAPRSVVFVERVPRHPNGKPDLEGARALALAALQP